MKIELTDKDIKEFDNLLSYLGSKPYHEVYKLIIFIQSLPTKQITDECISVVEDIK